MKKTYKRPSLLLRLIVPLMLILVWFGIAGVGGPYFGRIDEVSSNDISTFLPDNAESTRVGDAIGKYQDAKTIPAILVFESKSDLSDMQRKEVGSLRDTIQKSGVAKSELTPAIYSDDNKAAFLLVPLDSNSEFATVIDKLKTTVADTKLTISYHFTGPAMFARDLNSAFAGIDGTLLFVALAVVFIILLVVYRSPILPIVTLLGAMFALTAAILLVWHLAKVDILQLNGQVQGILFILVIGAATDYSLLYIARYREELMHYESAFDATKAAWKASWEPILAAGGTVTLGLLCLLASELGSNKALGPAGGVGVIFSVLSALTFLPAVLLLFGRSAFWPRRPKYGAKKTLVDYHQSHPLWAKVGALVGKYPRRLSAGLLLLLLIACCFVPQLKADGVSQSNLVVGPSEARDGQEVLNRHFPSGSGSPAYVLVDVKDKDAVVSKLEQDKGVDTVSVVTTDPKRSPAPLGRLEQKIKDTITGSIQARQDAELSVIKTRLQSQMLGSSDAEINQAVQSVASQLPSVDSIAAKAYPFTGVESKVVDGKVFLQATLKNPANSIEARETVQRLRDTIRPKYPSAQIGGVSALQLDTNRASERDLRVIIPLILFAITVVLMILLRSIVAPLILLVTTVISFGATLGIAALLFNHVWHYVGADPSVVIFGFVFLVALGIDYNIFLMTRVREETKRLGVRTGVIKALVVTGGVITSAGIVLASTFAALYVIPILFLAQIAFIVAFGVLLDTLIVRSIIVPGLSLTIGRWMWWPSKLFSKSE